MLQSVSEEASSHRGSYCSPEPKRGRDDVAEDDLKEQGRRGSPGRGAERKMVKVNTQMRL